MFNERRGYFTISKVTLQIPDTCGTKVISNMTISSSIPFLPVALTHFVLTKEIKRHA